MKLPVRSNFPTHALEHLPLTSLRKNPRNPRQHSQKQIDQLAKSIRTYGFVGVVVVDNELNIICGHARVDAADQLGMTTVPAIRVSHLTPAQRRAFAIADNKIAENASWDLQILRGL